MTTTTNSRSKTGYLLLACLATLLAACQAFTIGGSVSGLTSDGLVLANGTDTVRVPAYATSFSLPTPVPQGGTYYVTVTMQPSGLNCTVANGSGTMGTTAVTNIAVTCGHVTTSSVTVSTLAQSDPAQSPPSTIYSPTGIATDSAGNAYVAQNTGVIRITPAGVITKFAGSASLGHVDGAAATAQFNYAQGVAVDTAGNVFVADTNNHVIRKITPTGVVSTLAGSGQAGADNGPASTASFNYPTGITVDHAGNLYVADSSNHLIRKITPAGVVSTLAGSGQSGMADGIGSAASFKSPKTLVADATGNVYVADTGNHTIRKVTPAGVVSTLAGSGQEGSANGQGNAASFNTLYGIAVDSAGILYVTDDMEPPASPYCGFYPGDPRCAIVPQYLIRRIDTAGVVSTHAGAGPFGSLDGPGSLATFARPWGIAADSAGNLLVADNGSNRVRRIAPQ